MCNGRVKIVPILMGVVRGYGSLKDNSRTFFPRGHWSFFLDRHLPPYGSCWLMSVAVEMWRGGQVYRLFF